MDTKQICEKLEELNTTDLIGLGNMFINEADIGEGEITPFEDLDEMTGISGFTKALDDLGISTVFSFEYYADDIYYSERFLKSEQEARDYMIVTIESNLNEDNINDFKECVNWYKDNNNKEVIECILSMI